MPILCEKVHSEVQWKRCGFVETNKDCLDHMNFVNYLRWHYCYVDERNKFNAFWSVLAMLFLVVYVFWMMQFTVLHYFVPCLKVIADSCGLSQNTAGVTVLSVANGSPDLFMSFAAKLTVGQYAFLGCMAQVVFLHTFVAGTVMLVKPFEMDPNYFLRDFGFLFLNVAYMDYIFKRPDGIGWEIAFPSNLIFIGYIVVTIVDQYLAAAHNRKLVRLQGLETGEDENQKGQTDLNLRRHKIDRSKREGGRNRKLFQQFWHSVFIFDKQRFKSGTILVKLYMLYQLPIEMLLRLLIPVVDVEKPLFNWSKLLFCWHMLIVPTYITYILFKTASVGGVPYCAIAILSMIPVAVLIFLLTRTDTPPRLFKLTSALSFLAVVILIFGLLSEVNAMFFALATILSLSPEFATATAICWAISSNDLVTNILLAHQGFPNMAFTATFSTPVMAAFVYLALPITRDAFTHTPKKLQLPEGKFGETVCIYAEVALAISFLCCLTTNFQMRRSYGFFLVTYYIVFLGVLCLVEFDVIGAYGFK